MGELRSIEDGVKRKCRMLRYFCGIVQAEISTYVDKLKGSGRDRGSWCKRNRKIVRERERQK